MGSDNRGRSEWDALQRAQALRADATEAISIGNGYTQETQTLAEMTSDLVRQLVEAREQRDLALLTKGVVESGHPPGGCRVWGVRLPTPASSWQLVSDVATALGVEQGPYCTSHFNSLSEAARSSTRIAELERAHYVTKVFAKDPAFLFDVLQVMRRHNVTTAERLAERLDR